MAMEKIIVPQLGESVTEAIIAKWHGQPGDSVKSDDILVELETDKVTLEVTSPADGILAKITQIEGNTVEIGAVLGEIDTAAAQTPGAKNSATATKKMTENVQENSHRSSIAATSPAAGKIIREHSLNADQISGTGKDRRITKADALAQTTQKQESVIPPSPQSVQRSERSTRSIKRVKMTKLRQTIAKRLKLSQNTAAILATFNEVDMSSIIRMRKQHQECFQKQHGIKLGFMSFFVKAVVQALMAFPAVNAEIEGNEILYKEYHDIGVAVGTKHGLVVPVIRDAAHLSLAEIEKSILDLGTRARDNRLSIADLTGGTFSITNGGIYGSMLSTPIINPPQSAILGMHNIVERPIAIKGEIHVRPIMYLALSYDHRIIDGREAVQFLVKVKECIENPERLLLEI